MIKINGKEIQITKFPNRESLVDVSILNNLSNNDVKVEFKWMNDEDILHLYFVLGHLLQHGIYKRDIYVYYMPYSRMDRDQNGNCFTLSHVTRILNEVISSDDEVYIVEPHSDVTLYQLNKAHRFNVITPLMNHILSKQPIDIICYPDKGARNRFGLDVCERPIIYCEKIRNFDTGNIEGLELVSEEDITGKNILILDDLCSKGGTFYYTAKKLKEEGANHIYLGVCHMEASLSQGTLWQNIGELVDHIYCTNSMLDKEECKTLSSKITIYDLETFISNEKLSLVGVV